MAEDRKLLMRLYASAVDTAHPSACLPRHLPTVPPKGGLKVLAAGKAAAAMGVVVEQHYGRLGLLDRIEGVITAPYGYTAALGVDRPKRLRLAEGRHPVPDAQSLAAAETALKVAREAQSEDLLLVLLSGGASALWAAPVAGLTLDEKTALTRGLLKSGADIHEMNVVRRHLSRIKGGRLAQASRAGSMLTLAISDVPGDDPETIGSGPTVPDPTTLAEARAVLEKRAPIMAHLGLAVPHAIASVLAEPANETAKPGDAVFVKSQYKIISTPAASLAAAADLARNAGYEVMYLGDQVAGEARDVARQHAAIAIDAKRRGRKLVIISGGELSVTVRNRAGRGGRNQEYALALAIGIAGENGISGMAADTDGIDGGDGHPSDPAGALVDAATVARAADRRMSAQAFLDANDATPYFEALGDLVTTGPTHTNVNDFRAIIVDPGT